jgi:histidinol dehydrogenase
MIRLLNLDEASTVLLRQDDRLRDALEVVAPIVSDVRFGGDRSVRKYAQLFDGFTSDSFAVPTGGKISNDLEKALDRASTNIRDFAQQQLVKSWSMVVGERVLGQIVKPLNTVGVYVPAGRYPLLSTMLMAVIPAQVAGVREITIACPQPTSEMLGLAARLGITHILQVGGAQAIAAMAYGTETIARVERIVGPGNAYVAAAKKLVSSDVAIDFVAGPSEIVIIASDGNPTWIAADMLAQAEHDVDARAILITTSIDLANKVQKELKKQMDSLPTASVARVAIERNSAIVLCDSDDDAVALSNSIAPEHLSLYDETLVVGVTNAGSIFLGPFSPEAAGDYASGPNHILPTSGVAAIRGGLSVNDFVKVITTQRLTRDALQELGSTISTMARAEGLEAHARSVEVRLNG